MLSSVADAEDVVQEAFLRYHRAAAPEVESPKAYLSAVVTRLCIDHLRSARVRRETYVGEWLPEPLLTDESADPEQAVVDADSLSMAFLLVLERLSPVERAVFLLHDVFGYDFAEVAGMVERSPDNCRQIGVRARRHVNEQAPRFETSRAERDELARTVPGRVHRRRRRRAGVAAGRRRRRAGRRRRAPARPGRTRSPDVTRSCGCSSGWPTASGELGLVVRPTQVNGQPGATVHAADGGLVNVITVDIADGVGADRALGDQSRQAAPSRPARRPAGAARPACAPLVGQPVGLG